MNPRSTVIVVDDDAVTRSFLKELMASVGIEATTYQSPEEFLTDFKPYDAACLLFDIRLPGMSGIELLERVRALDCHAPAIIMSAYANVPLAVRAMKGGALEVLEKPLRAQTVLELVQEAVRRHRDGHEQELQKTTAAARIALLTVREQEILTEIVNGRANKEIAGKLGISVRTVEAHRARLMRKMRASSVAELLRTKLLADGIQVS